MIQHALALPLPPTPAEGRRARDRGLRRARSANAVWLKDAVHSLRAFCADRTEVRIEEFRAWWNEQGGAQPTSPNVWGALPGQVSWLVYDRHEPAKSVKTHSHRVAVYRFVWSG